MYCSQGIKVLMAVDFSSLLLKFRLFDHAAHLGGALFGLYVNTVSFVYFFLSFFIFLCQRVLFLSNSHEPEEEMVPRGFKIIANIELRAP